MQHASPSVQKNCKMSEHHIAPGAHEEGKPKMLNNNTQCRQLSKHHPERTTTSDSQSDSTGIKNRFTTGLQQTSANHRCMFDRCTRSTSPIDLCRRCTKTCTTISDDHGHDQSNVGLVDRRTCKDALRAMTLGRSYVNHARQFQSSNPQPNIDVSGTHG